MNKMMNKLMMVLVALTVVACDGDDKKPEKVALTAEQRADNPLLKMQDDTVNKAKTAINDGLQKQQDALDKVGQ